jgi:phosphoribosyl 1,2-cyclic phosphodiesterase
MPIAPPDAPVTLWLLGSGSQGNAAAVTCGERLLLLDAGVDLPALLARMREADLHPWFVEEVLLSHGHKDHVVGAAAGAKAYGWRVWATLGTVWRWRALRGVPVQPFEPGASFDAGPFRVRTARTPHDVDDSAAFVVEAGGVRVGYCTDLGHAPDAVLALLQGVDALVLESNYDEAMLRAGPYPPELQARVGGPTGHLGNAQAAEVARAVAHPGLQHLVLGHLSRHNNTPELALASMRRALEGTPFRGALHAAPPDAVLGPLVLQPAAAAPGTPVAPPAATHTGAAMRDDQQTNDKSQYLDDGFRDADQREGLGDDQGTRVGRPDGATAQPAPRDAQGGDAAAGQAGTNREPVTGGLEGSLTESSGPQQSRVRDAAEGRDDGGDKAGDDRRVFDL